MARKMTEAQLGQILEEELSKAAGNEGDDLASHRKEALDLYFCRPLGNELPGRSQVVSPDLSAMVDAVLAQTLNAFTTDNAVSFNPMGPDDEEAADMESGVVNDFVMQRNNGYYVFSSCFKDALLSRNAVAKLWIDERTSVSRETYSGLTDLELQMAIQPRDESEQVTISDFDPDSDSIQVERRQIRREFKFEAVPPENFLFQKDWTSIYLEGIRFCAERKWITRSDLIDMGYSRAKVKDLPASSLDLYGDSTARNPGGYTASASRQIDASQDQIECYECYLLVDYSGDGVSELRRIMFAGWPDGGTILSNEPADFLPYACGSAFPVGHRFLGVSLTDKLASTQKIKTQAFRQWLDNAAHINNKRLIGVEGRFNPEDAVNSRPGGIIRVKEPGAIQEMIVNDIGPAMQQLLAYCDQQRSELGGASLDLQSSESQLIGAQVGSQGLDRAYSVKEQLAAMMCRNLAETFVRTVYLKAHALLRMSWDQPVMYQKAGQWVEVNPSQWPARDHVTVKLGLSAGERRRKLEALGFIIQQQKELLAAGLDGTMVTAANLQNALLDWGRAAEIDSPEQYFIDPASPEAQQAGQAKQQQAQQAQQQQMAMIQEQFAIEREKIQADMRKAMKEFIADQEEIRFRYFDSTLKSEMEAAKLVGSITADLEREQERGSAAAGGGNGAA